MGGLLVMVRKQGGSQPDQRRHSCSLRHRYLLSPPPPPPPPCPPARPPANKNKNKTCHHSPQWPAFTLPGMTASTFAHARSHTIAHCGQSLCPGEEFFLSFFCLFSLFGHFLLFFVGNRRNFFFFSFKWEQRGRWLIVKGWGREGCLVRGIPRCCSPSAPGKEREKEGEFFFF